MKKNYFNSLILGIMCLIIYSSKSQNILYDGDFSLTTEIIPFDTPTPPNNMWAFFLNSGNGVEANPTVVDGVCNYQITNPGSITWEVQLAQWGFPLNLGHSYQLLFDVKADADRSFGVYLGENGGNWIDLIYDRYLYNATTEWQTISIEFEAFSVFPLHKLSFELGGDNTTTYFDNVILQDLGPAPPKKVVIAGTFQSTLNCANDWDPNCDYTELTFNSSTGLYVGTFQIPEDNNRYKVTVGGSWDLNYGENGIFNGADIFLCLSSGSEEITFTYDPSTNLVTTSPIASGFSPDCLPIVVLAGSFQEELGCYSDWILDCSNTALVYNSGSGLFEADLNIPTGCYDYRVVLENSWEISFGQDGIPNGTNYNISIPENPDITHFTYDPVSHIVSSTPYTGSTQVTKVSLIGNLQDELGCAYDFNYECDSPALVFDSDSGAWEGSFLLPAGCYSYRVKETVGCSIVNFYGEDGYEWKEIQLYVPSDAEITFSYDPQTHIITSTPYSDAPQEVTKVSLLSSFQQEVGLILNPDSGDWEKTFMLPAGCYSYLVQETIGCNNVTYYGENGNEGYWPWIQLYVPTEAEITFSYDPQTHLISSTPYSGAELAKVSLIGSLQDELGCAYDGEDECDKSALILNPDTGAWEGSFTLPAGCYTYRVKETSVCEVTYYGENGNEWPEIQLYVPAAGEITFSYDPQSHIVTSTPFYEIPEEVTAVSLFGNLQDEFGCSFDYDYGCDNPALMLNSGTGAWEGSFVLPAGCYSYRVKETVGCNIVNLYGEDGNEWKEIQLYVPSDGEITFIYDPQTHIISSTPYSGAPQEVTKVSLIGDLQDELGCNYDYENECDNPALLFNSGLGVWEGSFTLPAGCYNYRVKETSVCNVTHYGENGNEWGNEIQLYIPSEGEITFSYDPQTHIISSTPYSGVPQEVTKVSLTGGFQYELGCAYDGENECDKPSLLFDTASGTWVGSFMLPAGCYAYRVKETFGCILTYYGENGIEWGNEISLYVPTESEITFSYDPQTHIISSTPNSVAPQEVTTVSLQGTIQDELGCASDYEYGCNHPALVFDPDSGLWEGSFTLLAGCYNYIVKETFACSNVSFYGENGIEWGNQIQLFVPSDGEITFSYDPQTHILISTPYSGAPQEVTKVSLIGSLQDELGCVYDGEDECDKSALILNSDTGAWEGSFTLPAGCYTYRVKEIFGCNVSYYGENGSEWGNEIPLYVPSEAEITFSYDPQNHIISSTPYSSTPQEATKVSLIGDLQDELGCNYDYENECDNPALLFNSGLGVWEGSFTLPAGCYNYRVKETSVCNVTYYGENGSEWGNEIQLYVPIDSEITFSYNPQTHIMISTPYSDAAQELTSVSLYGTLQDEFGCNYDYEYDCDNPTLVFNPDTGVWEGSFTLPAGCYFYRAKETSVCNNIIFYGENGIEGGNEIQLYVPLAGEITFSYDPQTHIMSSTPYNDPKEKAIKVSLIGTLQDELGCSSDFEYECDNPALLFNTDSGEWEGSFTLPAGCYTYYVKETFGCDYVFIFGENGIEGGSAIELHVPIESEITFSYDPQTHILTSTPYSGAPQDVTAVSFYGTLQDELGCANDFEFECDSPALQFNTSSGVWEGSFTIPAGCYIYLVKEKFGCNNVILYGENGIEWGNAIQLYVPAESEITLSYDPETHIVVSTPYFDISDLNQCPDNITVNNSPGTCGAIVSYPEFAVTDICGGEIISITQTDGLSSGSMFPVGTTTNTFVLTKITGEEITCSFDVVVIDTESPVIADLNESYEPLWPPNHKMVPVFIEYVASDNCNISTAELSISSNEPETGLGNGDQAPDWEILDEHNVLLRAERSGKGNGREYNITIKVTDSSGNFTQQFVTVIVPLNNSQMSQEFSASENSSDKYILYPNAAVDIINLKGPKSTSGHAYAIYDMLGIMKKKGTIDNEQIEVHTLLSGVYILKFEMDQGYIFKKFIKN